MLKLTWIMIGGGIGTLLRYFVSGLDYKFSNGVFPVGTFIVNASGSLMIGFLWGLFERMDVSSTMRMFVLVGVLGGFTTFSTFSLESFNLLREGDIKIAMVNILATNIVAVAFVFAGFSAARLFLASVQ